MNSGRSETTVVGIHDSDIVKTADRLGRRGCGDAVPVVVLNLPEQVPVTLAEVEVVENYLGMLVEDFLALDVTTPATD